MKMLKADSHRNGVAGVGFFVGIFEDSENGNKKKLGIWFPNDDPDSTKPTMLTAVFDLELLKAENIAFGENSWRDDHYAHLIKDATELWRAEMEQRLKEVTVK